MRRVPILLLLVALTACSPAPPTPPPSAPATSASPSATPRVELPPRPRDLPIDGIDPCDLLTDAQRTELGLDGDTETSPDDSSLLGETVSCFLIGLQPRAVGVSITLAPNTGIERFTVDRTNTDITTTSVVGQPAVITRPYSTTTFCGVVVDVADRQLIDARYSQISDERPITQDQLCRDAELLAEYVVTNLLAR